MPNNETIERIAEDVGFDCETMNDRALIAKRVLASLTEMRQVALREAAEILQGELITCELTTDWEVGYNTGIHHSAAAILGRIDK